jgi:late competence protein required for DNA uptake (superfamily II DNA/RNA helicase)
MIPDLQKRPYQKQYKCNNCKGKTDSPAWLAAKIYCQKCTVYKRVHKKFPDKQIIKDLKEIGRWKN